MLYYVCLLHNIHSSTQVKVETCCTSVEQIKKQKLKQVLAHAGCQQ